MGQFVLPLLLLSIASNPAHSDPCTVVADSLVDARNLYQQYCESPRADCDPLEGRWYCSSTKISGNNPPADIVSGAGSVADEFEQDRNSNNTVSAGSGGESSCIDTDGDGWGWNGSSCRVGEESVAGNTSNAAAGALPVPENQACIDTDGDGWGWNGLESCRMAAEISQDAIENTPVVSVPLSESEPGSVVCEDTDGDGWGWDGLASCLINRAKPVQSSSGSTSATYLPSQITDLVLLTGQSNALGANTDYEENIDSPSEKVFAFTSNGWQRADLHQIWDRGWHPRNDPDTDPSNNLLLHFGKRLVALDENRVVGFLLVSEPGAAIANWDDNGEFYRKMESRVLDAINQLPHKSQLDGVLWHQGETDANDTNYYTRKLNRLIDNLRSENWFSSREPFICGEIAKRGGVNNRLNRLNSDDDPFTGCVSAEGLSTRQDGSHFDADGLRELGRRYADLYHAMTD